MASYSGPDGRLGYDGYDGYDDQSYSGQRSAGLLSGGTGDLTDGAKQSSVAGGYWAWSPYVLWYGISPVLRFDLGARHDLGSVTAYFNCYPGAAVYIPRQATLRFSDDGVSYGASQLRLFSTAEQAPGGNDSTPGYELLLGSGQGRFVELTLTTAGFWTALSEVSSAGSVSGVFTSATQCASPFVATAGATFQTMQVAVAFPGANADQVYRFHLARDVPGVAHALRSPAPG